MNNPIHEPGSEESELGQRARQLSTNASQVVQRLSEIQRQQAQSATSPEGVETLAEMILALNQLIRSLERIE